MRSRFAAYARGDVDYILATTHPNGAHFVEDTDQWRLDVGRFCASTKFDGLEILETSGDDTKGVVHFRAELRQNGNDASFSERSTFETHAGRWKYFDGEPTPD